MTKDPDFLAKETLRLIGPDAPNWVPDREGLHHNVTIVGGGQTGATFAFALRRAGIGKVSVIDAAPGEEQAGIWLTRARMERLRTPKNLPGPELGLPGLSFQAWFEGRHGEEAYAQLSSIKRTDWAAYLKWYREFLAIPIRYGVRLVRIERAADHFRLHLDIGGAEVVETTRKIILCTGVVGSGGALIPEVLRGLPQDLFAHTADQIDFAKLRNKSVAVVGSAASAFDAAGTALEAGAKDVHLFSRRNSLASVPINRVRGYPGAFDNYAHLPDEIRWEQALRFRAAGSTPPADSIQRATRHSSFHLHVGSAWREARVENGQVATLIDGELHRFDFVIAGTGYYAAPSARPELADVARYVRLWRDQYVPPSGSDDAYFGAHPYLGFGHEFLEKEPGEAPWLGDIHVYNPAGFVSFGLPIGDVPSIRRDVPAVVSRISRDLFLADATQHQARITGAVPADFDQTLYSASIWRVEQSVGS